MSSQTFLFTPQPIDGATGSDLWTTPSPSKCDAQMLDFLPPSAGLVAFGTQNEIGLQNPYTMAEPTIWRSGYTPGGVVFVPPNIHLDPRAPTPWEVVPTYFGLYNTGAGETFIGFGTPNQTGTAAGLMTSGMAIGLNENLELAFYCISEAGARTEVATIACSGVFAPESIEYPQYEATTGGDADDFTAEIGVTSYVDSSGASVEVTLPPADSTTAGQRLTIKDASGAASTNNIEVVADGSDTIDGEVNYFLTLDYQAVTVESNGDGEWYIV